MSRGCPWGASWRLRGSECGCLGALRGELGADRVVSPEQEAGVRVAHTFNITGVVDYLVVAPTFGIARVVPPAPYLGRTLRDLDLQGRFQLTPIALSRGGRVVVNPPRDEVLRTGDELVLVGRDEGFVRFGS